MSKNTMLIPSAEMKERLYKEWFGDDDRAFGKGRINAFADAYLKLASPLLPQQGGEQTVDVLEKLYLAAMDMVSSEPDMPSHQNTEAIFEAAMQRSRAALSEFGRVVPELED